MMRDDEMKDVYRLGISSAIHSFIFIISYFNVQLGEEMVTKLSDLPEKDHIPLCQNTLALTVKGLSQTSFGDYFKDDEKCHLLRRNYEIVSSLCSMN